MSCHIIVNTEYFRNDKWINKYDPKYPPPALIRHQTHPTRPSWYPQIDSASHARYCWRQSLGIRSRCGRWVQGWWPPSERCRSSLKSRRLVPNIFVCIVRRRRRWVRRSRSSTSASQCWLSLQWSARWSEVSEELSNKSELYYKPQKNIPKNNHDNNHTDASILETIPFCQHQAAKYPWECWNEFLVIRCPFQPNQLGLGKRQIWQPLRRQLNSASVSLYVNNYIINHNYQWFLY